MKAGSSGWREICSLHLLQIIIWLYHKSPCLKDTTQCLKFSIAVNNHSPGSWSFPRVPQGNSFLSFTLDNKSSSLPVVSGQCSHPYGQNELMSRDNQCWMAFVTSFPEHYLYWVLETSLPMPIQSYHGINTITSSWQMRIPKFAQDLKAILRATLWPLDRVTVPH